MITTTKYTLLTWLPLSLFEQFRRIANVYFLLISILMAIGTYAPSVFQSPLEPFSTLGTLIFVLLVTSLKEGYEDYKRKMSVIAAFMLAIFLLRNSSTTLDPTKLKTSEL